MHIACFIARLSSGGAKRVLSNLANYLSTKYSKVTIITYDSPDVVPFYPLNSKIKVIKLNQLNDTNKRYWNIIKRLYVLRKVLRSIQPSKVISFGEIMNVSIILSSIGLNIPIVISERTNPKEHKISKFFDLLRFKFYPLSSYLIIQTKSISNFFPKEWQHIKIIPNPVYKYINKQFYVSPKVSTLISVGRLENEKDHKILIKSFALFHDNYPDIKLLIYGAGSKRKELEQLAFSLKVEKKINFCGTSTNIYEELLKSDLFIFPSLFEGFPNALCEAMSIGLPVVASACSGNIDILEDGKNGRLFPIGDINVLTKLIIELIEDYHQRLTLSKEAIKIVEKYNAKKVFKLWENVLESITEKERFKS